MAKKVLARDWAIGLWTPDYYDNAVGGYQEILGINSFTISPAKDSTETTDFKSNGSAEHQSAERSVTVSFDGFYVDGDSGQERVESIGEQFGESGLEYMRLASPDGGREKYYRGSFDIGDIGGDDADTASFGFEVEVTSKPTEVDPNLYRSLVDLSWNSTNNEWEVTWKSGDKFDTTLSAGDNVVINEEVYTVDTVVDDENITLQETEAEGEELVDAQYFSEK